MAASRSEINFFVFLLLGALALVAALFYPYFNALIVAATFAVVFKPLHQRILRTLPRHPSIASAITVLVIGCIIVLPIVFVGLQVFGEARALYASLADGAPNFADQLAGSIKERLEGLFPGFQISFEVNQYIRQSLAWGIERIGPIFSGIAQGAVTIILALLGLYYLLKDGDALRSAFITLSPLDEKYDNEILDKLRVTANSVIRGTLVIALAQGILVGVGFIIFSIPQPALWGSLAVVTSLIPVVGTALVVLPAILYALFLGNPLAALGLGLWQLFVVGLVDNFLRTHLMRRDVSIHPLFILLSVLGGLRFFGPIGFLVGPLILSLLFTLLDIYPRLILKGEGQRS